MQLHGQYAPLHTQMFVFLPRSSIDTSRLSCVSGTASKKKKEMDIRRLLLDGLEAENDKDCV